MRVGQAAPLHRPCTEKSRLGRRELVVPLIFLVLLLEIHLTAPEGVYGEAGAAATGCGRGRGVVLSETLLLKSSHDLHICHVLQFVSHRDRVILQF